MADKTLLNMTIKPFAEKALMEHLQGSTEDEAPQMAESYLHGWNAAIDHVLTSLDQSSAPKLWKNMGKNMAKDYRATE